MAQVAEELSVVLPEAGPPSHRRQWVIGALCATLLGFTTAAVLFVVLIVLAGHFAGAEWGCGGG